MTTFTIPLVPVAFMVIQTMCQEPPRQEKFNRIKEMRTCEYSYQLSVKSMSCLACSGILFLGLVISHTVFGTLLNLITVILIALE